MFVKSGFYRVIPSIFFRALFSRIKAAIKEIMATREGVGRREFNPEKK